MNEDALRPRLCEVRLLASHQDQVEVLPQGARLLAASDFCPNAAFAIENHVFAVQGHPEFTRDYARFLMCRRRDQLGGAYEPGIASLNEPTNEAVIARWIAGFLAS